LPQNKAPSGLFSGLEPANPLAVAPAPWLAVSIQDRSFPALNAVFSASDAADTVPARDGISVKRILDVTLALAALLLLLPLHAVIAAAVVFDSQGPAIFHQRRIGQHGKIFNIYKFRTMHVLEDGAEIVQAYRGDTRITRIGKILRITSLDELPQLFNVLSGEMSLVGPRPHAVAHDEYYAERVQNYRLRHLVKPGITGWAQVNGARGATPEISDMQARIDFDVQYVERRSFWLDLKILARTPLEILISRNTV
jgi:putative colanic acid biosysnthesis UDP-glucose lipid carrier transferase